MKIVIIDTDEATQTTSVDEGTIVTLNDVNHVAFTFQRDGVRHKTIVPSTHLLRYVEFDQRLQLTPSINVNIKHQNKLLRIETKDEVDITLSGDLQMLALHVVTRGSCRINNDMPLYFREGAYIRASRITIDDQLHSPHFITLITHLGANNSIHINKGIATKNLLIITPELRIDALVDSEFAAISPCNVHNLPSAAIYLGRPAHTTVPSHEYHIRWRNNELRDLICGNTILVSPEISALNRALNESLHDNNIANEPRSFKQLFMESFAAFKNFVPKLFHLQTWVAVPRFIIFLLKQAINGFGYIFQKITSSDTNNNNNLLNPNQVTPNHSSISTQPEVISANINNQRSPELIWTRRDEDNLPIETDNSIVMHQNLPSPRHEMN